MRAVTRALIGSIALGLLAITPLASAADTPTVSKFLNIKFEFGSAPNITITPPLSNSDGAWSYTISNSKVAAVTGNTIIPIGVGSATIIATQAATSTFSSATINASLEITPGLPNVGTLSDLSTVYVAPTSPGKYSKLKITAPYSNSTGAWTFTSLNPAVATIAGTDISILGIGEAPIVALQQATPNFLASKPIQIILSVTGPSPTLAAWSPIKLFLKDARYTITPPSSPSDGAWSFSLAKTDAASLSGNILTLLKAGNVVVNAAQAKSKNSVYGPSATSLKVTIVKNPTTVGTLAPLVAYLGEPSVEVVNPTSDSPGSWNYSTSDQKIAKVKNGVIVPIAEGVVTVTATQNATEIYDASTPVQTTLVVGPAMQTPTVGNFDNLITYIQPNPIKVVPPASTSSGAWSYKSSNSAILESDGEFLTPVGVGLVTVTASQARTNTFGRFEKTFQVKVGESFTVTSAGGKNLITIKSSSPDARVTIDGQPAHLGGNKVVAGSHQVKVYINGFLALQTRTSATGLKKVKK